ncbi:MAG: hypothetical protein AB7P52_07840 [Alphaproteobacteria bacterium]
MPGAAAAAKVTTVIAMTVSLSMLLPPDLAGLDCLARAGIRKDDDGVLARN